MTPLPCGILRIPQLFLNPPRKIHLRALPYANGAGAALPERGRQSDPINCRKYEETKPTRKNMLETGMN
jgi:hypothetical protein